MTVACRAALAWALVTVPLQAQSPAERTGLDRLRDSIATSTDVAGLRALEAEWIARARANRDDPVPHLRLGLIALRLAAVAGEPHLEDAITEFEWAAELRPDWPWPWYGLGLAQARGPDRAGGFGGGLWTMLGLDRERLAGFAFARAIAADPTFVGGLVEYARVALDQRLDAPVAPALRALRAATATPRGWHPDLLLARGRLERLGGDADSAVVAFERYRLLGRRIHLAQLELARTLPLVPGRSAEAATMAYLAGAATRDPEVVALYRRDLEPIARDDELAAFDATTAATRAAWLEAYWRRVAAADLRDPAERVAEHFRRWDVARRGFRLPPFRRRYRWGLEIYQSGDAELDDRGVIWLRHGAPTLRIEWGRPEYLRAPSRRAYGSESWRYDRPDGPLVLHFVARDDPQDFRVVETPTALDVPLWMLEARAHELPGLDRLIRAGRYTAEWVGEEVRRNGRASIAIATESSGWERAYAGTLTGRAQWLAAGERNGQPLAHLIYAVDADSLRRLAVRSGRTSLPLRIRAAVLGPRGDVVATLDTVQEVRVPGPTTRLVAARVEVPVAPGLLRIRYGVEAGEELGVVYPVDSIVAPRVRGARLDVSALLIGREGRSLPWVATPADTAWLDAGGVYAVGDTVIVYAEAYGIPEGREVQVELTLSRARRGLAALFGGRSEAIALREQLTVVGGTLRLRRGLGLGQVAPGNYALELVIRSEGRSVVRRRGLTVAR